MLWESCGSLNNFSPNATLGAANSVSFGMGVIGSFVTVSLATVATVILTTSEDGRSDQSEVAVSAIRKIATLPIFKESFIVF